MIRSLNSTLTAVVFAALLVFLPQGGSCAAGLLQALEGLSRPLQHPAQLDPLLAVAGDARLVLLGEASHGTHEFYAWRDRLSRRLVAEYGFSFIAIEGDWSSLVPLDQYVRHRPGAPASAREALQKITRWPRWVWANEELAALGEWLRSVNRDRPPARRVGIHGIDLYAVWESIEAVQAFYRLHLPASAASVADRYRFLRAFDGDYRAYTEYVRRTGRSAGVETAAVADDLAARYLSAHPAARERLFEALQHARAVEAGERYLASQGLPDRYSWNLRARHFALTVAGLLGHYGPGSRGIVWAHNTHVGDARATDMVRTGEFNLGQLLRERFGADEVFILGLGTAAGHVWAAGSWEAPGEVMPVPPPRSDSLEAALLASGDGDRLLTFDRRSPAARLLRSTVLPHRAIGVVFEPRREPWLNYVPTRLADRYDAFIFLPTTRPLDRLEDRPDRSVRRDRAAGGGAGSR